MNGTRFLRYVGKSKQDRAINKTNRPGESICEVGNTIVNLLSHAAHMLAAWGNSDGGTQRYKALNNTNEIENYIDRGKIYRKYERKGRT